MIAVSSIRLRPNESDAFMWIRRKDISLTLCLVNFVVRTVTHYYTNSKFTWYIFYEDK